MEQQLLFCWNHIDPELRQFVNKLNKETKVINFIKVLEDLKETWELKYQMKSERKQVKDSRDKAELY